MTPREHKQIQAFNRTLPHPIDLKLFLTRSEHDPLFTAFCENLSLSAPMIRVDVQSGEDQHPAPSIGIGPSLFYRTIPLGAELPPFLDALAGITGKTRPLPSALGGSLESLKIPCVINMFIAPQCPHCPNIVRQVLAIGQTHPLITVVIVDAGLFPEDARINDIQSVPTVIVEDRFRWTGSVDLAELVRTILHREPHKLGPLTLKNMLENGKAADVAQMMAAHGAIFESFLTLLIHDKWPVRLGAMVAFEYLAEIDAEIAARAVNPLWQYFQSADDAVKGDILYLFGETGQYHALPKIDATLKGPYTAAVKEAAREAREKIVDSDGS